MTLGGRRVEVSRRRMRTANDERELPVQSYEYFADRDPLTRAVMAAGRALLSHPQGYPRRRHWRGLRSARGSHGALGGGAGVHRHCHLRVGLTTVLRLLKLDTVVGVAPGFCNPWACSTLAVGRRDRVVCHLLPTGGSAGGAKRPAIVSEQVRVLDSVASNRRCKFARGSGSRG
jgi:hypothetical protein